MLYNRFVKLRKVVSSARRVDLVRLFSEYFGVLNSGTSVNSNLVLILQTFGFALYELQLVLVWLLQTLLLVFRHENWLFGDVIGRHVQFPDGSGLSSHASDLMLKCALILNELVVELLQNVLHVS